MLSSGILHHCCFVVVVVVVVVVVGVGVGVGVVWDSVCGVSCARKLV